MLALLLVLAAASGADARLVCSMDEKLVVVTPETGASKPVTPQPPARPVALGAAGDTLVGVSAAGAVLQLRDGQWRGGTRVRGKGGGKKAARVDPQKPPGGGHLPPGRR